MDREMHIGIARALLSGDILVNPERCKRNEWPRMIRIIFVYCNHQPNKCIANRFFKIKVICFCARNGNANCYAQIHLDHSFSGVSVAFPDLVLESPDFATLRRHNTPDAFNKRLNSRSHLDCFRKCLLIVNLRIVVIVIIIGAYRLRSFIIFAYLLFCHLQVVFDKAVNQLHQPIAIAAFAHNGNDGVLF